MENFTKILNEASNRCNNSYIENILTKKLFCQIYPFTTENISGYINEFNLKDKSLLTVGSSGDQALNAILKGCKDITILDINSYTKFYFYLKMATILELDKDQFLEFLKFSSYDNKHYNNEKLYNINTFNKIKKTLRLLDYESYLFWDELIQNYDKHQIRSKLFYLDEDETKVIENENLYLKADINYNILKNILKKAHYKFIIDDIENIKLDKKYDNIWLSNILGYANDMKTIKNVLFKYSNHLNDNGKLLLCYLYGTSDILDNNYYQPIYNLKQIYNELMDYNLYLCNFEGTVGMYSEMSDCHMKNIDSVLVYKKNK